MGTQAFLIPLPASEVRQRDNRQKMLFQRKILVPIWMRQKELRIGHWELPLLPLHTEGKPGALFLLFSAGGGIPAYWQGGYTNVRYRGKWPLCVTESCWHRGDQEW